MTNVKQTDLFMRIPQIVQLAKTTLVLSEVLEKLKGKDLNNLKEELRLDWNTLEMIGELVKLHSKRVENFFSGLLVHTSRRASMK